MSKIRFEAKALSRAPRNPDEPWKKIINAVGQLIDTGMPPSNAELRTLLLPHVDYLPPEMELPETFQRFLREVDIFLATQQRDSSASLAAEEPTAEVARAAKYLAGSDMVVLGGDCRVQSRRAMIAAFGLANLNWVETRAHESIAPFEAAIARENVKVVLLVIRWASHSYGDIKAFCETYGKPLVRLPGGYGINQVAHQICEQCTVDA